MVKVQESMLTSPDTTQAQIKGYELAQANIYPIYELLQQFTLPYM